MTAEIHRHTCYWSYLVNSMFTQFIIFHHCLNWPFWEKTLDWPQTYKNQSIKKIKFLWHYLISVNFTPMTFSSSFPSIPCSGRLVPCAGASPVFRWRRSGGHVSCGGPGGGDKVGPQQPVGAVPSVSGPVHVLGPAWLRPQPRLHLAPQHPLWRFSSGEGGGAGATPPARPRPRQYRLHPDWWGNFFFSCFLIFFPVPFSFTCILPWYTQSLCLYILAVSLRFPFHSCPSSPTYRFSPHLSSSILSSFSSHPSCWAVTSQWTEKTNGSFTLEQLMLSLSLCLSRCSLLFSLFM